MVGIFRDKMILPVLIPMALGQTPKAGVINSIKKQTIETEIIGISTEGIVNSHRNFEAMSAKFKTLRSLQQYAKSLDSEYIALNDSDIVHLSNDNLEKCIEKFEQDKTIGYVACWYHDRPMENYHVRNASCVLRRKEFININLDFVEESCTCMVIKYQYSLINKKSIYVDSKKRIEEIID